MPPYISGEVPESGDRVSDRSQRTGNVAHIRDAGDGPELVVDCQYGTTAIPYQPDNLVIGERAPRNRVTIHNNSSANQFEPFATV
jgi:hypothetical protein